MGSCWSSAAETNAARESRVAAERVLTAFRDDNARTVFIDESHLEGILQQIDEFEQAIQENMSVTSLHLALEAMSGTYIHEDRYYRLCRALSGLKNLNYLNVGLYDGPEQDYQDFLSILQHAKKVRYLDLSFLCPRRVENEEQQPVSLQREASQGLVELQEMQIIFVSSRQQALIQEILPSCQNLRKLRIHVLRDTSVSPSTVTQILQSSIQEVSLIGFNFDSPCCFAMASALASDSSLVEKLAFCNCNFDGHSAVFRGIAQSSGLESLELRHNYGRSWNDFLFACVGNMMATNDTLTELVLHLSRNDPPIAPLFRGLATNGSLRKLVVSAPNFDETVCEELGSILTINSALQELEIFASMTCKGRFKLLQFIPVNQTLKELRLYGGRFGKINDAPLPDAYKQNFTLEKTEFFYKQNYTLEKITLYSQDDAVFCRMLEVISTLNKAGRSYLRTDAGSRAKGVEVFSKVTDDLDCLFTHLVENPSLCDIVHDTVDVDSKMGELIW